MNRKELDRTDLRILETIQSNGRITNQNLAKQVMLSPSACHKRLHSMEAHGLITNYRGDIALEKIRPIMIVYAEISMRRHVLEVFERFEKILANTPEIVEASRVSGPFDYMAKIVVTDMQDWKELAVTMLNEEHGVEKVVTQVVMQTVKRYTGMPIQASLSAQRRLPQLRRLFNRSLG